MEGWALTPASSWAPTRLPAHSSPLSPYLSQQDWQRTGRAKGRELVSWDKESLVGEEKAGGQRAGDAKAITRNCPKADQGQPSLWATAALKEEPSLPSCYCWAWWYVVCSISLGSLDQLSQLCPLPNSLPTSNLLILKTSMLCKHCWVVAKTPVCYQGCFSHRSRTQHPACAAKEANSVPARLSKILTCSVVARFAFMDDLLQWSGPLLDHKPIACPPGRAMGPLSCE